MNPIKITLAIIILLTINCYAYLKTPSSSTIKAKNTYDKVENKTDNSKVVKSSAFDALVALMVEKYYASIIATSLALGLLHSSRAIGLVIGPIMIGNWINNKRIIYIFIFQTIAVWIWASVMQNFYLSLLASVLVGFFTTTLWSYTYTLLQKNIEEKYYGRIVAYNDMLFLATATLTSFMIVFLATNNYSLEAITSILGCGFIVGAVYVSWVFKAYNISNFK